MKLPSDPPRSSARHPGLTLRVAGAGRGCEGAGASGAGLGLGAVGGVLKGRASRDVGLRV